MPAMEAVSDTTSRVVPGMSVTMARSCSKRRLKRLHPDPRQIFEPLLVRFKSGRMPLLNAVGHYQAVLEPLDDLFYIHVSPPPTSYSEHPYCAATNVTHTGEITSTFSPDGVSRPFREFTRNT